MKSTHNQEEIFYFKAVNAQLREENRLASINIIKLQNEIELLKEQFRLFQHQRFAKDRAVPASQGDFFFNEAETIVEQDEVVSSGEAADEEDVAANSSRPRRRGGRRPLPAHLPRIEVVHDLPDAEKSCPHDGGTLHRIGEEVSEQLDIIPAKIQVIRHIRIKYGCSNCEQVVKTTPLPPQPIPKSNASPGLLAYIVTAKYADGLPLYRLENILDRYGAEVPRATSAAWMIRVAEMFIPLVNLLRDQVVSSQYVHMDETPVQVLKEPGKSPTSTSYFWGVCNGETAFPVLLFEYDPSRSGQVPLRLLEGFTGALQTDGYDGYNAVVRLQRLLHLGCWAHVVRKFKDVLKAQKEPTKVGKANYALGTFKKLYLIEEQLADATPQARHARRQIASLPIVRELRAWLDKSLAHVPPTSLLGKAMHYMHNEWTKLIRCFDDGRYALDNNKMENAIRPFVIGRNNWLFSDTVNGAKASATLYSVIETAKANGLEPYAYLRRIIKDLPGAKTLEDIEALLPWNIDKTTLTDTC